MAYYSRSEYPRYQPRQSRRNGPQPAYYSPYHSHHELERYTLRPEYEESDSHGTTIGDADYDDQNVHPARRRIAVAVRLHSPRTIELALTKVVHTL